MLNQSSNRRDEVDVQERLTKIFEKYDKRIGLKRMSEILFENAEKLERASKEPRVY